MKFKRKFKIALCLCFVFLTCFYSFYVPSFALDQSAFMLSGSVQVNGSTDSSQTQLVPMTTGVIYDLYTDDDNVIRVNAFCTVDTGHGFFTSNRFGAYYLSSNTEFNFSYTIIDSGDATSLFSHGLVWGPGGSKSIGFRVYFNFTDGTTYGIQSPDFFVSSIIERFDTYFNSDIKEQSVSCVFNLADVVPDKIIQSVTFRFDVNPQIDSAGNPLSIPSFLQMKFNYFSLGSISIDQGNLDEVEEAEQMGQEYQQQVQNMSGIGAVPDVNPIGLVQGSSEFMRWASHTYSIPVLSSMIAITLSFSILFFLLKKR